MRAQNRFELMGRPAGIAAGLLFLGWAMIGCASGVSKASRAMVTYKGSFSELQAAPDRYRGQVVMLGGRIVETTPSAAGTEITVLQLPLGVSDKPSLDKPSQGRFLISSPEFLDPAAYPKLTLITVVGEVTGHTVRPVGEYPYTLPVVRPIEIKQWTSSDWGGSSGPAVNLGIGAGSHGGGAGFGISF